MPTSLTDFANAVDRRLTRPWTRRLPGSIDGLLMRLSRAADHSGLWLVVAAAGGSFAGKRGRRAAGHGVLALAVTSATVNGPIKLLIGRRRPAGRSRLRRRLRTSSFPSGHSASGFAFAVAASRELPEAGPVLLPLRRLRRLLAGLPWRAPPDRRHRRCCIWHSRRRGSPAGTAKTPDGRKCAPGRVCTAVALTGGARGEPHAGNSRKLARARRALESCGIHVAEELDIEHVDRLPGLLQNLDGASPLVIAAGGDGTVGSVAGHLVGADAELGILPLRTGNDFARALGIPLSARQAAEQLAVGTTSRVDLGRVTRVESMFLPRPLN